MHRTDGADNVENKFTDEIPGTVVTANWLNAVQEEICGVVEGAGMSLNSPSADTANQLLAAINDLINEAIAAKTLDDYPIGDIYVQYPVAKSNDEAVAFPTAYRPATKFGGSWSELYDDENIFFRTKGTDGQTRTSGLSEDQMQRLTGNITLYGDQLVFSSSRAGVFNREPSTDGAHRAAPGATAENNHRFLFDSFDSPNARTSATTSGFTEPRNRLFKVWIRTA